MPGLVWLAAAYLLGSVPSALLAGKWLRRIDLREYGSGNLGATNVYRVLGAPAALTVLAFDFAKGALPVLLFPHWTTGPVSDWWPLAYAVAAVAGHVRPIYLGGRGGGKGVATASGAFLALAPVPMALTIAVWCTVLALTRIVSLASLCGTAALPVAVAIWYGPDSALVLGAVAVAAFVFWTHRGNIDRLRRGVEPRIGRGSSAA